MLDMLLLPFQLPFMTKALWMMVVLSVPTALLSCFLVLKGWSLMGDAVSHAVLPGVVLTYILGLPLLIGAFATGLFCALATGYLAENSRIKRDTVMGVVFSGMFALGLVLYAAFPSDQHLDHILFGNMLGISTSEIWTSGGIAVVVSALILFQRRDLLLHSFDPGQAQVSGLPVRWLTYGLLTAISLTVVATLDAVGLILAIGLLIAPGAIAFLLVRRFEAMLVVAVLITGVAGVLGVYVSFFQDSAPAPTVILILTGVFLAAFVRRRLQIRRATGMQPAKG